MTSVGIQVPAYSVGSLDAIYQTYGYAYGTGRANKTVSPTQQFSYYGGVAKQYAKGRDGLYKEFFNFGAAPTIPWRTSCDIGANAVAAMGTVEVGVQPVPGANTNYIITGGRWRFKGQSPSVTVPVGNIIFTLYSSVGGSALESKEVASCIIPKSKYATEYQGASDFWVYFGFAQPFVYGKSTGDGNYTETNLTIGMKLDVYTGSATTDFVSGKVDSASVFYTKGTTGNWFPSNGTTYGPTAGVYGTQISMMGIEYTTKGLFPAGLILIQYSTGNSTPNYSGKATAGGASSLTDSTQAWDVNELATRALYINSGTGQGQSLVIASNTATVITCTGTFSPAPDNTSAYTVYGNYCDASGLEVAVSVIGLADVYGTITATPGDYLTKPHEIINFLQMQYKEPPTDAVAAAGWVAKNWNITKYASLYSQYFVYSGDPLRRLVSGVTTGDPTVQEIIQQIVSELCLKVVNVSSDGKLAVLPWGSELTVSKVFTDENCNVLRWEQLGIESIVNSLTVSYLKTMINYTIDAAVNADGYGNYAQSLSATDATSQIWKIYGAKSAAVYGKRESASRALNWVMDPQAAAVYLAYTLSTFDYPHRTVTISTSLVANYSLSVGDVVEIMSARLPAHLGTIADNRSPYYNYTEVDVTKAYYMSRATRYRAQIVTRTIDWSKDGEASLTLTLRLLRPYHPNDPT